MTDVIVNADDFGATLGMTQAIIDGHKNGIVNSTSLMVTMPRAPEAVEAAKSLPDLKVGLHLNLTNEKCAAPKGKIPLLVDEKGKFKNGFLNLLILSLIKPFAFRRQVMIETQAQIAKFKKTGLTMAHIDSHRHVHMIPAIFKIVRKAAEEHGIPRIRVVNESLWHTFWSNFGDLSYVFDGGLIKYAVLKTCYHLNEYYPKTYFYSILYTGRLAKKRFEHLKIPARCDVVEIGIHPGRPDIEKQHLEDVYDPYVLSNGRTQEYETVCDQSILRKIK